MQAEEEKYKEEPIEELVKKRNQLKQERAKIYDQILRTKDKTKKKEYNNEIKIYNNTIDSLRIVISEKEGREKKMENKNKRFRDRFRNSSLEGIKDLEKEKREKAELIRSIDLQGGDPNSREELRSSLEKEIADINKKIEKRSAAEREEK